MVPALKNRKILHHFLFLGTWFWLSLFFIFPCFANAGNFSYSSKEINSLPDTTRLNFLIRKGKEKRKTEPDSALWYFNRAFTLCEPVFSNSLLSEKQYQEYSDFAITALNRSGLLHYFACLYDSATIYFEQALTLSRQYKNRWQEAESLFNIAEVHLELGNFDEALKIYNQSMQIYRECNDPISVFYCYNSLGILAKLQGDYNNALIQYTDAYNIADSLNDELSKADILNNMGNVYKSRGEYAHAMENYDQAFKIFEEKEESLRMSDCLCNMGDIHNETGSYQRSLDYYRRSLKIAEEQGDKYRAMGVYKNMGEVFVTISDYRQAKSCFDKAIRLATDIGDRVRLADCYEDYGKMLQKQGNYQKAFEYYTAALELAFEFNNRKEQSGINISLAQNAVLRRMPKEAIDFAERGEEIAAEIGALKEQNEAFKILSDVWLSLGDSTKAFLYYRAFSETKDTLLAIGQQETIERIEARHQLAESEKENELLVAQAENRENKIRLQRTLVVAMTGGLLLLALILALLIRRNKDARIMFSQKEQINRQKLNELNLELDFKNRELTAKALHLVQKEELIGKITDKLQSITGKNENPEKELNRLAWELKSDIQKDNWGEFEHHFQQVHPQFYHRLNVKYPNLTANEKKICAFLKLNLRTKDISSITGQSVKSIEVARTRLRKKFGLNPDENLNIFVNSI